MATVLNAHPVHPNRPASRYREAGLRLLIPHYSLLILQVISTVMPGVQFM